MEFDLPYDVQREAELKRLQFDYGYMIQFSQPTEYCKACGVGDDEFHIRNSICSDCALFIIDLLMGPYSD